MSNGVIGWPEVRQMRDRIENDPVMGICAAAIDSLNFAKKGSFSGQTVTVDDAKIIILRLCQHLIGTDRREMAAKILWGDFFHTKPRSVQRIFKALHEFDKVSVIGAGGRVNHLR